MRWTLSGRDSRPELRVKLSMSERRHLQPNRWQVFALHQRMDGNENCHLSFHHLHNNNNLVFFVSFRLFHPTPFISLSTSAPDREKCAPIHARMALGVRSALNVVPVTTTLAATTSMERATACPATEATKSVKYFFLILRTSIFLV